MGSMRRAVDTGLWACVVMVLVMTQGAAAKKDTAVEPSDYGKVAGWVYDAATGLPLSKATVTIQEDGVFADTGKTVGTTGTDGAYACEAQLGRVSSKIDWKRVAFSSVAGLLSGSAKKVTKTVDISRLNMRVAHDRYHAFEGPVLCRSIKTQEFSVLMEPIFLTKEYSDEASTVAEGWGVAEIVEAGLTPPIARAKDKVTLTVKVKTPPLDPKAKVAVVLSSMFLSEKGGQRRLSKFTTGADGLCVFTDTFRIAKKSKGAEEVTISLAEFPYCVKAAKKTVPALFQALASEADEPAAQLRLKAYQLEQQQQYQEALGARQELCNLSTAITSDRDALMRLQARLAGTPATTAMPTATPMGAAELEAAIAAARTRAEADSKNQDFAVWHNYALLLVRKSLYQQESSDPGLTSTLETCETALSSALKSARSGKRSVDQGHYYGIIFGYYGSAVVGISGFDQPEAGSDFLILESMRTLRSVPNSYLDYLNMATALTDLGQTDLALKVTDKCLALRPDCVEAKYVKAVASIVQGDGGSGLTLLQEVAKANPRHSRANLILAKAYTLADDPTTATEYLAAHEAFYGLDAKPLLDTVTLPLQGLTLQQDKRDTPEA